MAKKVKSEDTLKKAADKIYHQYSEARYPKAILAYKELLTCYPENVDGWCRLSTMQLQIKLYDDAVYSIEKAIELDPKNESIWRRKSTLLHFVVKEGQEKVKNRFPVSADIYREVIVVCDTRLSLLPPEDHEIGSILEQKAKTLELLKEYKNAIAVFEDAALFHEKYSSKKNINPVAHCFCSISRIYETMEDYKSAIEWNKKWREVGGEEIGLIHLARILLKNGNVEESKKTTDKFLTTIYKKFEETKDAAYMFQACGVYNDLMQYDEALMALDKLEKEARQYPILPERVKEERLKVLKLKQQSNQ